MNRTALHDLHVEAGGKMVDFSGWELPVQYDSIVAEHLATRESCTVFDVSHMGRIRLQGPDVLQLLETLCTRRIADMDAGQCRYTHICREDGGILDDVIVSRFDAHWLVVCNASNREKILKWFTHHAARRDVMLNDQTLETVMLAVQGPQVLDIAEELLPVEVSTLKRYRFKTGKYLGIDYFCSRTGYTGEDGFELILPRAAGRMVASSIYQKDGAAYGRIKPAGLGARDTLRLEAAMPLYGHELSEEVDPLTAGQRWCVDLEKEFVGGEALRRIDSRGTGRQLVGLKIDGRRIARQDTELQSNAKSVGRVTSGTFSPTLQEVIAMAYVDVQHAAEGTALDVCIRGKTACASIVPLPFYKRPKTK